MKSKLLFPTLLYLTLAMLVQQAFVWQESPVLFEGNWEYLDYNLPTNMISIFPDASAEWSPIDYLHQHVAAIQRWIVNDFQTHVQQMRNNLWKAIINPLNLDIRPLSLHFRDKPLESEFTRDYKNKNITLVVLFTLLSSVLFGLFYLIPQIRTCEC